MWATGIDISKISAIIYVYNMIITQYIKLYIYGAEVGGAEDSSCMQVETCIGRQCKLFGGGKAPSISLPTV